jgi:hypothetical protein
MDVFSTELGIRLSFVKTSEFPATGTDELPDFTAHGLLIVWVNHGGLGGEERFAHDFREDAWKK